MISNFYNQFTKNTLSKVESIMTQSANFKETFENKFELVFTNVLQKDIASFKYNFNVMRNSLHLEVRKEDLIEMMWRFRMTKKEVESQLRKQFNHNPEFMVMISLVEEL